MKSDLSVVVDVRAADVGYFSTKFTLGRRYEDGAPSISTALFPSFAPVLPTGSANQSGFSNRRDGVAIRLGGVEYFVGRDSIAYSSGREPREVLSEYSQTDKYLALLLGALHYMAVDAKAHHEFVIRHLVVGLPLNTFNAYHEKLKDKVTGEHLLPDARSGGSTRRVTVEKCSVLVQPQGALVSCGGSVLSKDNWVLVVDAGGGTLDWYLARGQVTNWQRSGAYPKCMLACAYAVADQIDQTWRDNFEIIERIDKAIRDGAPSFTTGGQTHYLHNYERAIETVLNESTHKMAAKLGSFDNLDMIFFAGGGAKVYAQYFAKRYPKLAPILHMDSDPVFSIVKGFHLSGELMAVSVTE